MVDLYQRLARHRVAIKLVDRCATELPELASVWLDAGRGAQLTAIERYLRDREAAGVLQIPGSVQVVARTVVELCVLWAVHCHSIPHRHRLPRSMTTRSPPPSLPWSPAR